MSFGLDIRKDAAFTRQLLAVEKWEEATKALNKANAEVARVLMLDTAETYPDVTGFSWAISWEYDDEGGYYASTNVYANGVKGGYEIADFDELLEVASYLDEGAMEFLGPQDKEVTIAQLKAMTL